MEDVLDVYQKPYNPRVPVVCMDEQPVQLVAETRTPLPMLPGCPQRFDHEYRRLGTTNVFLFTEPLAGWRRIALSERKTQQDWAREIHQLLTVDYPHAKKVILVCDNLNTHKIGSLYEAYPPEVARNLIKRLEIHYTPKHGSWLNIAECELSTYTRQCLGKRTGSNKELETRTKQWVTSRNQQQVGVDWQFKNKNARIKLKRLYPKIKMG